MMAATIFSIIDKEKSNDMAATGNR